MSGTGEVAHATTPNPSARRTAGLDAELRLLAQAVRAVTSVPVDGLDVAVAAQAHDELRGLCDRLRAYGARLLAQVESDGRWAASGSARTLPQWVGPPRRPLSGVRPAGRRARQGPEP